MEKHPIGELMETTMQKIREMVDVNTIIGQPINAGDGLTLIPISRVSFGFASGGADMKSKAAEEAQKPGFGGGSGAGIKIVPMAFVVVKDGDVQVMNVTGPDATAVDRLVEAIPGLLDKMAELFKKDDKTEDK